MSDKALFDTARQTKRDLTGEALAGLTTDESAYIKALVARWRAAGEALTTKPGPKGLGDAQTFYKAVRQAFGTLSQPQVDGFGAVLQAVGTAGWPISWAAYALATTWHETGRAMQPNTESLNYSVDGLLKTFGRHRISETDARKFGRAPGRTANQSAIGNIIYGGAWGKTNLGNTQPGDGFKYRGRGLDHTTGRANYTKVDKALGLNGALLADPDLLLKPENATRALVTGMESGRYTTKKLADYLPTQGAADKAAFTRARYIINGQDRAAQIADLALKFQSALQVGRWQ